MIKIYPLAFILVVQFLFIFLVLSRILFIKNRKHGIREAELREQLQNLPEMNSSVEDMEKKAA